MVIFFCDRYGYRIDLLSFPTRRSSDLDGLRAQAGGDGTVHVQGATAGPVCPVRTGANPPLEAWRGGLERDRSEEHTSELQSQSNLVCRLLLEKKNGKAGCRRWKFLWST